MVVFIEKDVGLESSACHSRCTCSDIVLDICNIEEPEIPEQSMGTERMACNDIDRDVDTNQGSSECAQHANREHLVTGFRWRKHEDLPALLQLVEQMRL